jgi:hypothetical protein
MQMPFSRSLPLAFRFRLEISLFLSSEKLFFVLSLLPLFTTFFVFGEVEDVDEVEVVEVDDEFGLEEEEDKLDSSDN